MNCSYKIVHASFFSPIHSPREVKAESVRASVIAILWDEDFIVRKLILVTRIARTGLGTRLRQSVFFSSMNKTKGGSARRVKDAEVFYDLSSYTEVFFLHDILH